MVCEFFVKDNINFKIRNDLQVYIEREIESIFIEIIIKNSPLIIGQIYRVPNSNPQLSIQRYMEAVKKAKNFNWMF